MTAALLWPGAVPRLPSRRRALVVAVSLGVVTGLVSSLPSPLPDLRFDELDILINARTIPLHAGIVFGAMIGGLAWLWTNRDPAKCLLTVALVLAGWLAAINTANDVIMGVTSSELFGTVEGAKASREAVGWLLGGVVAGGVGAGLTAFGMGIPASAIRRTRAWALIVATGMVFGCLLYAAAQLDTLLVLFVPWQAAVAASIALGLTAPKA
jgi:hypothetical protein